MAAASRKKAGSATMLDTSTSDGSISATMMARRSRARASASTRSRRNPARPAWCSQYDRADQEGTGMSETVEANRAKQQAEWYAGDMPISSLTMDWKRPNEIQPEIG